MATKPQWVKITDVEAAADLAAAIIRQEHRDANGKSMYSPAERADARHFIKTLQEVSSADVSIVYPDSHIVK